MSIRQRPRISTTADTTYIRPVSIDVRDQSSIANRLYAALYGQEYAYIVAEGDDEVFGEGPLIYRYDNQGYTYDNMRDLQEYTYTITEADLQDILR